MPLPAAEPHPTDDLLWAALARELLHIYDAHHVCVAAAQLVARHWGLATVVMLRTLTAADYDVWLCRPQQPPVQMRCPVAAGWTERLEQGAVARLQRSAADLPDALREVVAGQVIVAPFGRSPFVQTPPGCICVVDGQMAQADVELLARLVTGYLERAVLRYHVVQQEIVFEVVNDISLSLTSTLSLEDIFDKVANPVRRILNVESVSIGLVEPGSGDLVFVPELLGPYFSNLPAIRLQHGQGIAGWVARHGRPALVNDVYQDERFFSAADAASGFQTRSILCVPLRVENVVIGVVEAVNKKIDLFNEADLHMLLAIANPLAIALENARLHSVVLAEKRRIETIFDHMAEGMCTVDANGILTDCNDSLLTLLQVDVGRLIGAQAAQVIKVRSQHDFAGFVQNVLTGREDTRTLACDVYVDHRADAAPVLISGASILDDGGRAREAILVFSDLRQIREVERMRDDFFHNIVHELRTPLATILMYARLLRKSSARGVYGEKDLRFLDVIERESDRLQQMVRQMLDLAKLEAQEVQRSRKPVSLNELLDQILPPLYDRALGKGLQFTAQIEPDLPSIMGDEQVLESIFKNLVENAIKFTLQGLVRVEAWCEDHHIYVEVADQGIGIPQEALPNLFKRFYRTQTAVAQGIAGTGLGLYMVKEGVEQHKGSIHVISALGRGATFVVRLPAMAAEAAPTP